MHALPELHVTTAAAIGWFYLVTNAARIFTYVPQIVAVWRSTNGARSISLFTWSSWLVSHSAAIAYGALVVHDPFFVAIALVNFCGCGAVTLIAWRRRLQQSEPGEAERSVRQPAEPIVLRAPRPRSFVTCPRRTSAETISAKESITSSQRGGDAFDSFTSGA